MLVNDPIVVINIYIYIFQTNINIYHISRIMYIHIYICILSHVPSSIAAGLMLSADPLVVYITM